MQGEGRYASRDDVAFVEHGNMPTFAASDALTFWQAADANERANGRAYREVEFAVPRELDDRKSQIRFAQRMADGIVGVKHPYTLAMHDTEAADGGRNVHVHLMFSERALDGVERDAGQFFRRANKANPEKGGAAKDRTMNARTFVTDTRQRYERTVNRELERLGADTRVSMTRNTRLEPEPKLGPAHPRAGRDVRREVRMERVRELRAARMEWNGMVAEHQALRSAILDLSGDIQAAKAERERQAAAARVPDPHEQLARFRAARATEAAAPTSVAPVPTEDELRARDAEEIRQKLLGMGYTVVLTPKPRVPYTGEILLVSDFHVAQNAGRDWATLHDRRQLQQAYEVGDRPRIVYGADGHEQSPKTTIKPRGLGR
ncbi:MobA/MobL family protein [Paraburkholderia sp. A1RI-2L]|uniref:MobA/MobL family protein n=1 Tax=Paraburkholderia sp. A1RI-2L TaxID=3028367 RepID=UPI003B7A117A